MTKNNALIEALEKHKQEIDKNITNKKTEDIETEQKFMEDFFQTTISEYDEFEEKAWAKGEGYQLPRFKSIEENLEGLDEGLYLFAGESNSGKTACMLNILFDACQHKENKLFGVYYTLDDSTQEVVPRIIAMNQQIPIGLVAKPQRFQNMLEDMDEDTFNIQQQLEKRTQGLSELKKLRKHFKIVDSNKIRYAEDIYDHMKAVYNYIKAYDEEYNMIVGIDALNDIRFRDTRLAPGEELNAEIAITVKKWSVEFGIPILGSSHLRKLNSNRRPVLDDLKNSVEYVYESSVVFMVYNDVSKNSEAASMYYSIEGMDNKYPVIELDWAKNKKSSYKLKTFCHFIPEYSRIEEVDKETAERYNALIYEN